MKVSPYERCIQVLVQHCEQGAAGLIQLADHGLWRIPVVLNCRPLSQKLRIITWAWGLLLKPLQKNMM